MKVNSNTSVDMPLKNLISIIGAVAVGVWAYFGIIERLNTLETDNTLIKKDLNWKPTKNLKDYIEGVVGD